MYHPNWQALSTVPLKITPFVSESNSLVNIDSTKYNKRNLDLNYRISGDQAKNAYIEILTETPNEIKVQNIHNPKNCESNLPIKPKEPFNVNKLMLYATNNDTESINNMSIDKREINITDVHGWSALMVASCAGSANVVESLLKLGAEYTIMDRVGNTAFSLANDKGHKNVISAIVDYRKQKSTEHNNMRTKKSERSEFDKFFCESCQLPFEQCSQKEHHSSTLHLFNGKHHYFGTVYGIPESNKGYQLMMKSGWNKEAGLGPSGSGQKFPVQTVIREGRTGLGIAQSKPRVSHFSPYDADAVKSHSNRTIKKCDILHKELKDKQKERKWRRELS